MDIQECYRILKLEPGTDWPKVKKSFHTLAREHHPDRNAGNPNAEEKFKKISLAYQTLERWTQSHSFAYQVYAEGRPRKEETASPWNSGSGPLDFLPAGLQNRVSRWREKVWAWLKRYEQKWLELNVEKVVTIDALTASQGGTLRIKNPAGSFHVQVPKKAPKETVLRIPGKGEVGLFNRVPGDLLLTIRVDTGKIRPPGVTEFFYQVRVFENQLKTPKVQTLFTHEGPLHYRLPKSVKVGQSFVLKSKPHPKTGKASHHILVIDLL